jgi:hypothetical protein
MTELDDVLDKSVTNNASKSLKAAAAQIKDSLTQSLESVSPDYLAANQLFSNLTGEIVDPLKSSVIGKISKLSDDKIDNITSIIFDPKQTNPSIIKNAKQVISDIDPGAWDEILRVQLQKRIGGLFDALEDVDIPNSPSALKKALYGNNEQRKVLLSGMNTTQRANFVALEDMLIRQSRGRKIGSPTDSNQSIRKWLSGSVLTRAAEKITTPYGSVKNAAQDTNFSKNAKNLAKIMFDPDFAGDFQRLQGQAKTPATIAAFIQFLTDSSKFLNRQEREEQQKQEQQG